MGGPMAGKRLIAAVMAGSLLLSTTAAQATWPVLDEAALVKLTEQIKAAKKDFANQIQQLEELKKQLSFLTEIRNFINEVFDAVGEVASIILPITSLQSIAAQLARDTVCLLPDGISWGIQLDDLNLADICELSSRYHKELFASQDDLANATPDQQQAMRQEVEAKRAALLADVASRSLALGDMQLEQVKDLNKTATDMQTQANGAKTLQKRLAVLNQIQIANLRAAAQRNQILAQMLKLQAAVAVRGGLGLDEVKGIVGDEDGNDGKAGDSE